MFGSEWKLFGDRNDPQDRRRRRAPQVAMEQLPHARASDRVRE